MRKMLLPVVVLLMTLPMGVASANTKPLEPQHVPESGCANPNLGRVAAYCFEDVCHGDHKVTHTKKYARKHKAHMTECHQTSMFH